MQHFRVQCLAIRKWQQENERNLKGKKMKEKKDREREKCKEKERNVKSCIFKRTSSKHPEATGMKFQC
jgi:hypothetical protein